MLNHSVFPLRIGLVLAAVLLLLGCPSSERGDYSDSGGLLPRVYQ